MSDIELVLDAKARDLGNGVTVGRVLPALARRFVGPFMFLDHMGPTTAELAVRPHPHLHLATVTYLFDGAILHRDSVGSKQIIEPGAINWMIAGTGIAHSERPPEHATAPVNLHGLQIWVGLPKAQEDVAPSFVHTPASALPQLDERGFQARVLAGSAYGKTSPVVTASPLFYVDVKLDAGATLEIPGGHTDRAIYVIDGAVTVGDTRIEARHLGLVAQTATSPIRAEQPTRLVIFGGEPLDGPRYMWWNFVSSSKERIIAAAEDWRAGKFAHVYEETTDFIPAPDGPRFASE